MTKRQPLEHKDELYEGEIKKGDIIIYQSPGVMVDGMPTVYINLYKIESLDMENNVFKAENCDDILSIHRISRVIVDNGAYPYKGFDHYRISNEDSESKMVDGMPTEYI